jgi:hypothetical protein
MADVLEVYTRPSDPQRPQVCLEATSQPLVADTRLPIPAVPGRPERIDNEYERQGTAHRFMVFTPWAGPRLVQVTERRTALDVAQVIQALGDAQYPQAEKLVLVMDHLNTHTLASLSDAFAPAEARRLTERLEMHDTPKHGSWLHMAETERSVLATPCVDRRIPTSPPDARRSPRGHSDAIRPRAPSSGGSRHQRPESS